MQRVQYIIDTFDSSQQAICECKRSPMSICTCTEAPCTCNGHRFDTVYINLPAYFVQSRSPNKRIILLQARLIDISSDTFTPIAGSLHSSLIQMNESADNYCMSTNMLYPVPPSFTLPDNRCRFECWCRSLNGTLIDLDQTKTRLILETVLEY